MTPATLRSLAARVMAGENTDDLNEYIFNATAPHGDGIKHRLWQDMNGKMRVPYGMFFRDLNAADALMAPLRERGWRVEISIREDGSVAALANTLTMVTEEWDPPMVAAPTEPRARTALALLCRAVELEHADADQR